MEQQKQFELDGVVYMMTPCNAGTAWAAIKNALKLLQAVQGINVNATPQDEHSGIGIAVIGAVLSNLGDPSVKALEDIIYKHTVAQTGEDKPYRLSDAFDKHFNQYRSHLLPMLKEGLIYQFADFFTGGAQLLNITARQTTNK